MSGIFAVLFVVFAAVMWRLRGGAFATLTGINIGTQWTRAACGLLMTAPLGLLIGLWCVPMGLAIWAGLALTGWEEFQQMGTESVALLTEKPQYWMRWLPWSLGLRPGQVEYDLFGMAQAGMVCMAPLALLMGLVGDYDAGIVLLFAGLGFAQEFRAGAILGGGIRGRADRRRAHADYSS
jgi:hypothetical protein